MIFECVCVSMLGGWVSRSDGPIMAVLHASKSAVAIIVLLAIAAGGYCR